MLWLYSELSTELSQLDKVHPNSAQPEGLSASQQCQLVLLQANARHCLAKQPGNSKRSVSLKCIATLPSPADTDCCCCAKVAMAVELSAV